MSDDDIIVRRYAAVVFVPLLTPGDVQLGDIVSVNNGISGYKEGLVVGSYSDWAGRQILEVQLEPGNVYHAWYPTVTRVKRVVSVNRPATLPRSRTVQRTVYW
ncbi:hypothetical protein FISHEDRAFT_45888 [Fistulina hepatica ATCC 64428]|uniref:Uncharacterized protein n=1 Tax=Fistulina hepatica ATCC 64428 TaxID=1128425 RepID=A0A0D7AB25_9AGAR|nr:hypothetical protein FISHEDRAFT_45888 [Fistulina hepatica ATCC 64428]